MPEWLTRKVGPLPIWGYALGGVALFFLYRRGKAASSSTASTTGATSNISASVPDIPTASVTTPSGFSYTGPLGGLQSLVPTGALGATNGGPSGVASFTGVPSAGIGFGSPTSATGGQPFVAPSGQKFSQVTSQGTLSQLFSQNVPVFWEPTPGNFQQAPFGLPANTPQFVTAS